MPEILRMLRMPLYFVLSGLFFKDYGGFIQLLVKKTNKLLIPFLFFYLAAYLYRYALLYLAPNLVLTRNLNILDIFYNNHGVNSPIWFLLALYWCNLLFCTISLSIKGEIYRLLAVLSIGALGAISGHYNIFLPCHLDSAFTSLPFFYLGYILKRSPLLYPNKYDKYNIIFVVALIVITSGIYLLCGKPYIDFLTNTISDYWPIVMCGCASFVLAVLLLCKIVKRIPVISYLGRYSIVVLCIHSEVFSSLRNLGVHSTTVITILVLLICWGCIPLFVKYLPWFTAQKDLIPMPKR